MCLGPRGDRTVLGDCPEQDTYDRVIRFFFHKTKHCIKFSLCPTTATLLDELEQDPPTINYFQNLAQCEEACINGIINANLLCKMIVMYKVAKGLSVGKSITDSVNGDLGSEAINNTRE